jgi:hypothetical protein
MGGADGELAIGLNVNRYRVRLASFLLARGPGSFGAPALLLLALIHRSAWKVNSANFALTAL